MPHDQSPELTEPRDGSLDDPASTIASQLSTVLSRFATTPAAMRTNQFQAFVAERGSQSIAVVGSIGNQNRMTLGAHSLLDDTRRQLYFRRRRGVDGTCQRYSLAIRHHHPLCTFSTLGFSDVGAPFFAGAKLPSMNSSSQSIRPCSSSSSMKACHIVVKTPASSHSTSRRQHVLGDGNDSGRSFHRAPLRSTQRIASKQARSQALGRPPRRLGAGVGMKGLTLSHCRSLSKTSLFAAIERLLSMTLIP